MGTWNGPTQAPAASNSHYMRCKYNIHFSNEAMDDHHNSFGIQYEDLSFDMSYMHTISSKLELKRNQRSDPL